MLLKNLKKSIEFIKQDSFFNAEKVPIQINSEIDSLAIYPQKYPIDKYKNDSNYRAFEIYHYRIAYKITDTQIIVLRFRSTYQEPKLY